MISTRISDQVQTLQTGPCTLLHLPVSVPQVVEWYGSFASNPNLGRGEELIQKVLAILLKKGTRQRDRFASSYELERKGADINVGSAGVRMEFRGSAMTQDVPDVMALMAEILREPLLDEDEFIKVKGRMQASLEEARDSADMQVVGALCRRLFSQRHPSYIPSVDDDLAALASMSIDAVRSYYEQHVGANELIVAVAGDIGAADAEKTVRSAFNDWEPHSAVPTHATKIEPVDRGTVHIHMDERPVLRLLLGHAIPVARSDPEWLPLHLGACMLWGNISIRLDRKISGSLGLTYESKAGLRGQGKAQGYFGAGVKLSQENLERGIAEVQQLIRAFVEEGVSWNSWQVIKTTEVGRYLVDLDSTGALATRLHHNQVLGFTVDAIDTFVDKIGALTLEEVGDCVVRTIRPDDLFTVIAGTLSSDA